MKVKTFEHDELVRELAKHGVTGGSYYFHKRRGWVHLVIKDLDDTFAFHRKDDFSLADQNLELKSTYKIKYLKSKEEGLVWSAVLVNLNKWLDVVRPR